MGDGLLGKFWCVRLSEWMMSDDDNEEVMQEEYDFTDLLKWWKFEKT